MEAVKVITLADVNSKLVQTAVTAFVKDWVKRRNDAGESTPEIAKSLGFKSHASVVQYLTPGHPVKVTDAVQRRVAELAFGGSRDRLDQEALRWFEEQQHGKAVELPPEYVRALGQLDVRHGRDFSPAARSLFASQPAFHGASGLTIELLARQIEEEDARMRDRTVERGRPAVDPTELPVSEG